MKLQSYLLLITAMAAPSVFADTHLTQIRDHAAKLNSGFQEVNRELRTKQFNLSTISNKVDLLDQDIEKLKALSNSFEASNPNLTPEAKKEWMAIKETITLLEMFHDHKAQMLKGDVTKMRGQLRSQAENLSIRATHLQKVSDKLLRSIGSGS